MIINAKDVIILRAQDAEIEFRLSDFESNELEFYLERIQIPFDFDTEEMNDYTSYSVDRQNTGLNTKFAL